MSPQAYIYIVYFDLIVCLILIPDFIYRLWKSDDRRHFLYKNWYDILGMVPIIIFGPVNGIIVNAYNTNITTGITLPSNNNEIDYKTVDLTNGQNETGTIIFNNPEIKSLAISGNGITKNHQHLHIKIKNSKEMVNLVNLI